MFIEIQFVLKIWLGDYPAYTPIFVQLILIQTAEMPVNYPVGMIVQASGNIEVCRSLCMTIILLVFPVSYVFLLRGFSPICVYIVGVIFWFNMNLINIYYANKYSRISIKQIVIKVLFQCISWRGDNVYCSLCHIYSYFCPSFERFLIVGFTSIINSVLVIFFSGVMTDGTAQSALCKIKD